MTSGAAAVAPEVDVVGGGLAGLAAAVALTTAGCRVKLFEARRMLGGRATSFRDPATGELVDQCQHVGMGCCTNLADFCQRTGIAKSFARERALNFIGPDGRRVVLQASHWLPAPLHLGPSLWRLRYLSRRERLAIARALWKLMRTPVIDSPDQPTVGQWLIAHGQSARAIEQFWNVILNSALGESLDRASLASARKVLVDGFMANRAAYELEIPRAPLGNLYGQQLESWLQRHGVQLSLSAPIRQVTLVDGAPSIECADGSVRRPQFVVLALPWSKLSDVVEPAIAARWSWLPAIRAIEGAPITAVHLWFDRPITDLPHAVLIGRLSQWIFQRGGCDAGGRGAAGQQTEHYYQVVISASRQLSGRDRQEIITEVCGELASIWPAAAAARLLTARVVTEPQAVFSAVPGLDQIRPSQQTAVPGVLVAGDWTDTGWPATMESAVRSGYLAAEAILRAVSRPQQFLVPDLRQGWLARRLIVR